MLDGISHERKLRSLHRSKDKTREFYKKKIDEARKQKKSRDEILGISYDEMYEIDYTDDKIAELQLQYLFRQAERGLIPIPKFKTEDEAWEESTVTGRWRLTPQAMSDLRAAVRHEKKEHREHIQTWLTVIAGFVGALTGLVGALIGLLAVLASN